MKKNSPLSRAEGEALDWFVCRRGGAMAAAQEAAFRQWLDADISHRLAYEGWERDWTDFGALPATEIARLRRRVAADAGATRAREAAGNAGTRCRRGFSHLVSIPRAMLAAACLSVLAAGAFAWQYWNAPVFNASYITARGESKDMLLPDGSRLQLDTASRADVVFNRRHRDIRVWQGQARFEVASDASRPFKVDAGDMRITVTGTRFALRHTPDMQQDTRLAVEEGRVRVEQGPDRPGSVAIELGAGQQISTGSNGMLGPVTAIAASEIATWRADRVSFDNASLQQVLAEFERYGDTGLLVRDRAVGALRLSGTFDPRHPENFAKMLPRALPVRLEPVGHRQEIRAR